MAGNPSFDGIIAFASEKMLNRSWSAIYISDYPMLRKLKVDGLNFNTATEDQKGNSVLLPVAYLGPATSARKGTNANRFTPITPNATQGATQAQYYYARFENALYLDSDEKQLIAKSAGDTTRMPILPMKIQQLTNDFKSVVTSSLLGTQNGTGSGGNGDLTGLQYFLSTSNSPGGISQLTYTNWAAGVVSTSQVLYEGIVDKEIHRINDLGRGAADYLQLSYSASNDVYGKFYGLIAPSQVIVDQAKSVAYGFTVFKYRELDCFMDGRLGTALAGSMVVGRSNSWYVNQQSEAPVMVARDGTIRLPGTTSDEYMYEWRMVVGCDDPAGNTLISGII